MGYSNIRLRLDLLSQEVHFQNHDKVEMVLPKGLIREVVLKDSASRGAPHDYLFRCGFTPVDNQDRNNFYRVLASGKITLLESERKVIATDRNDLAGEVKKEIREYDDYYFYQNGTMQRWKKDKALLLELVADQRDKVDAFVAANSTNFKSIEDIGRLITYYNGLARP
jgi:hypothetical protein